MSPVDGSLSGRQPKAVQSALQVLEQVARVGVGVFDETVTGDVFADYNPWEVRR